ncbi:helix-turn-helix transcriptional regulator [Rufibacter psychrotolerans]|uniref:helix-turn-helix transcriptional regulator n=1 Tax=Rufibacter psychrotolerans TaxID=2812556 RepID=UPI0019683FD7|nr:AraC family transcriptional regulator [Rufibacter sp. SYSU D00308]
MFLKEFPDYRQLKERADSAFRDPSGPAAPSQAQPAFEWPLVILNTQATQCHRPDIKGPFSLFTNLSGTSYVSAGNKKVAVPPDCFFLTNRAQHYTLDIDSPGQPIETFNLHLGQDLWEDFVKAHISAAPQLLDNPISLPLEAGSSEFPNLLQRKTPALDAALARLHRLGAAAPPTALELQEHLVPVLHALLQQKQELHRRCNQLAAAKASARAELFKRIALATDYLLAYPDQTPTLEALAQLACLSKFHFLRAFSQVHGRTPHQFLLQHRIERSLPLLQKTRLPVGEVALLCGYPEVSAFSRTFRKIVGCSPARYRLARN